MMSAFFEFADCDCLNCLCCCSDCLYSCSIFSVLSVVLFSASSVAVDGLSMRVAPCLHLFCTSLTGLQRDVQIVLVT